MNDDDKLGRRWRSLFVGLERPVPLADGRRRPCVNFDNAATTPAVKAAAEAVQELLEWYGSVHRGTGLKSAATTRCYDECRAVVGDFVGADPDRHVVLFTRGTTDSINKVACTLGRDGARPLVLCTQMEHHSNLLPWRVHGRVDCVDARADGTLDLEQMAAKLQAHAGRVRLVAVTGASNVTGLTPPVGDIARLAHAHGAEILVDAAQLVAHREIRMGAPDDPAHLDYIAFSGHKVYAPFGTGVLVGPRATFQDGVPERVGGGTVRLVTPDDVVWADLPQREEAGTPNVVGAVALAKAIGVLRQVGMAQVAAHDRALRRRMVAALQAVPTIEVYGDGGGAGGDPVGVIGFRSTKLDHGLLAAALCHEWGVAVRHGCFCAHAYLARLVGLGPRDLDALLRRARDNDHRDFPGLVRISFGLYNTPAEVEYVASAIRALTVDGPRCRYVVDRPTGEFLPEGGGSPLEECFRL